MAAPVRNMVERSGRYYARVVVPERVRPIIGKRELTAALGGDKREALRKLPATVAAFNDQIDAAERRLSPSRKPRAYSAHELAQIHYSEELIDDDRERDAGLPAREDFWRLGYMDALRKVASGRADTDYAAAQIGWAIDKFAQQNRAVPARGSEEWRNLARTLAAVQLETLERIGEREAGDFAGSPRHPLLTTAAEPARTPNVLVKDIFDGYRAELERAGKGRDSEKRWGPIITNITGFLGHPYGNRITRQDAKRWKESLLASGLAAKTVRDGYLATARAAFSWALDNDMVELNPFHGVKVRLDKKAIGREKGFDDAEALAILKAARAYRAPSKREHATTTAAKQWTPLLAAYTGARIGELTQLRVEDVKEKDGIPFIRITPDAGTVKTGEYRDVPLHPHLIELGFLDVVKGKAGPLFYRDGERTGRALPAQITADRVGAWVRSLKVIAPGIQPNHGWRHRMKTVGREAGIDSPVLDAIQGHAGRTAGENYGDVTLKAKADAINKLPRYALGV